MANIPSFGTDSQGRGTGTAMETSTSTAGLGTGTDSPAATVEGSPGSFQTATGPEDLVARGNAEGLGASLDNLHNQILSADGVGRVADPAAAALPGDENALFGISVPTGGPPSTPTTGDDFLTGNDNPNTIDGLSGNDTILGLGGNDVLLGGPGGDLLFGGRGNDQIEGNAESDLLDGGLGADRMVGGTDTAPDIASFARSAAAVSVNLLEGLASGGDAQGDSLTNINDLLGSRFDDTLVGDDGDNVIEGGRGGDELIGGSGIHDIVSYLGSSAGIAVNLTTGLAQGGDAEGDLVLGFEGAIGSTFDDILIGTEGRNLLVGDAGNDQLFGAGDYDVLQGGFGSDQLTGGTGFDDFLFARDEFVPAGGTELPDVITDYQGGEDDLIVINGLNLATRVDITQAGNGSGFTFDSGSSRITTDDGLQVVATLANYDGGAVFLI